MINAELTWVSAELYLTRGGIKSSLRPMFEIKVRANRGFVGCILTAFGNLCELPMEQALSVLAFLPEWGCKAKLSGCLLLQWGQLQYT